jgi:hypothetical protein
MKFSLTEKWRAVEEMGDLARETIERRRSQGLQYIDPLTGERVPGSAVVPEEPSGACTARSLAGLLAFGDPRMNGCLERKGASQTTEKVQITRTAPSGRPRL